ncbi:hypothetical protein SUGI_0470850 [Cryptomeria japonica]|uniref:uncharacterized protein LOC131067593 n=1 Tax=Cryptomeria japonica TaxID=3369 RepID=UPI002408DFE7|nr:uncharacterized protein LOC131067593 [Cryptomeria japonica]GLJ24620.1 hypothetical protein SUGI_0470850 [Cryptomeria japonica]
MRNMERMKKVLFPVRKAILRHSSRFRPRKAGKGSLVKLHKDVENCGYEDVQVMWEMLKQTDLLGKAQEEKYEQKIISLRNLWRKSRTILNL